MWKGTLRWGTIVAVLLVGWVGTALAQDLVEVPTIEDAEMAFEEGIEAFERGNYEAAYARFASVDEQPLNRQTTAALLMGGKALYQMEEYEEAIDMLNRLIDQYPDTQYRGEAERIRDFAREAIEQREHEPEVIRLGIALPMSGGDASLTQAMFNGIRLAAEERNGIEREMVPTDTTVDPVAAEQTDVLETAGEVGENIVQVDQTVVERQVGMPSQIVRLHFRDTHRDPERARAAVDSLIHHDNVDAVIGPLYSNEARAAGGVAEQSGTVLIAPLATDDRVSADRQYVFQTNPTMRERGAVMARHATRGMLMDNAGIIREQGDTLAAQMAEGFQDEMRRLEGTVTFDVEMPHSRAWSRMPEHFEEDTLAVPQIPRTESVYVPVAGNNAHGRVRDAAVGIERMERLGLQARALGNRQWHGASVERATYTNDFHVDETRPEVQEFVQRYRLLTGETPDELSVTAKRLAYTGYDVADYILSQLASGDHSLPATLRNAGQYEGLGIRIDFQDGNVNEAMFIHQYRNNRSELVR